MTHGRDILAKLQLPEISIAKAKRMQHGIISMSYELRELCQNTLGTVNLVHISTRSYSLSPKLHDELVEKLLRQWQRIHAPQIIQRFVLISAEN